MSWSEAMKCKCGDLPNPMCLQWEYHWERRDTPGGFTTQQFIDSEKDTLNIEIVVNPNLKEGEWYIK